MDIERVLRNTPSTLSVVFYGDAFPVDADGAVTVNVIKPDGTALFSSQATSHGAIGSGQYNYILPAQPALRTLRLDWTGTFSGVVSTITSYIEVVGGFYFTLYEARNFDSVIKSNPTKYPDESLEEARTFVETEFEALCGRAFVPRGEYEVLAGDNSNYIILEHPEIIKVNSLKVDGADWTASPVMSDGARTLKLVDGTYFNYSGYGAGNISIEYEYGMTSVPADIKRAALKRMRSIVIGQTGTIDERATLMSVPDIGTFSLATPGRNSLTGIPEVDAVLQRYVWAGGVSFG